MTTQGPTTAKAAAGTVSGHVISKVKKRVLGKLTVQARWTHPIDVAKSQVKTTASDVKLGAEPTAAKNGVFSRSYAIKNIVKELVNKITVEAQSADGKFAGSEEVGSVEKQGKVNVKISLDD